MKQYPRARKALETLIRSTIERHGTEICSKRDPLLSEIGTDVYLEPIVTEVYSGWRISPKRISQSLEKLLEVSLQTLSQLPKRYPKPDYSPRKPRLVASHLHKVGEEVGVLLQKEEVLGRVRVHFADKSETDRARLLRIPEERQQERLGKRAFPATRARRCRGVQGAADAQNSFAPGGNL